MNQELLIFITIIVVATIFLLQQFFKRRWEKRILNEGHRLSSTLSRVEVDGLGRNQNFILYFKFTYEGKELEVPSKNRPDSTDNSSSWKTDVNYIIYYNPKYPYYVIVENSRVKRYAKNIEWNKKRQG